MLGRIKDQTRYMRGVANFLREKITPEVARQRIHEQLKHREASFLDVLQRGIYAVPASPYRRLLVQAGLKFDGVAELIKEAGLEGALVRLHEAGVFLTLEEVRGRTPVRRGSLEFQIGETDLDNPLLESYFEGISSGSRSAGRRVFVDFRRLEYDACHVAQLLAAHGLIDAPIALWRPTPPDSTGLNNLLRYTKIGARPERWFSQASPGLMSQGLRATLLLYSTLLTGFLAKRPLIRPRFVPRENAWEVARWLAEMRTAGSPAAVDTSASGAVRICRDAIERGLDIRGTAFIMGGEPYTLAKASVLQAAGARGIDRYSLTEVGSVGFACANPAGIDDMHFAVDKVAVIQREKIIGESGERVPALVYTSLLPTASSLMLNTESGDYGELHESDCGCLLATLGLRTHLTGVGSYDKLTSEGVSFMRQELYALLEDVLPSMYGGYATDYQLVEEEVAGLPRVSIVVSPTVGEVDEPALVDTVLKALDRYYEGGSRMANEWRRGQTLRVLRREPFASGSRKILPLFVISSSKAAADSGGKGLQ